MTQLVKGDGEVSLAKDVGGHVGVSSVDEIGRMRVSSSFFLIEGDYFPTSETVIHLTIPIKRAALIVNRTSSYHLYFTIKVARSYAAVQLHAIAAARTFLLPPLSPRIMALFCFNKRM